MAKRQEKKGEKKAPLSPQEKKKYGRLIYILGFFPLTFIICLVLFQPNSSMPPVSMLDNPPELLASMVYADDAETELGRFWQINRTSVPYEQISPYVFDALISTEDERFMEHNGIDFQALARAIGRAGQDGGGSTITQQLAKLLFTLQMREEAAARGENYTPSAVSNSKAGRLMTRVNEIAKENIIATRLEKRFTKEEILTMYLNQFDFLYNAVGIENAAKIYFNKKPIDLTKSEAAMLVGMCKNPALYNPHMHEVKNYRQWLANRKNESVDKILDVDVAAQRSKDSTRAANRRNQVLFQWLKNSNENNGAIRTKISREEYDKLIQTPIVVDYQIVDHKEGVAPYFREAIRKELKDLFNEIKPDGSLKYQRADGRKWNIYNDGLKIYTTLNLEMQQHAEEAMETHLKIMQPKFRKQLEGLKSFPYRDLSEEQVARSIKRAKHESGRYQSLKAAGLTKKQIDKNFSQPTDMSVFSWNGDIDTTMSPLDSILYYKTFLRGGMLSVEPQTGFIKAWVGGADIRHFSYDCVSQTKRQVGSTIKPFVYATALAMGASKPCTTFSGGYCVGNWCPGGKAAGSMATGLAYSSNPTTVAVMSSMGPLAGKENIAKFLRDVDINLPRSQITPPMCLGTMSLTLKELIPAQAMFVNQGIYNSPTTILRIEDRNGNVIYQAQPRTKEVLNQNVAYEMIKMLEGVVNVGTSRRLRGSAPYANIRTPMAGKTGTTQNNSDAWFVGYTPELVTGVWVGGEERAIRWGSTGIGQGAAAALPAFGYYINKLYKDPKVKISKGEFEKPKGYDPLQFSCDALQGVSGGEYYFYKEPKKSDDENPFL